MHIDDLVGNDDEPVARRVAELTPAQRAYIYIAGCLCSAAFALAIAWLLWGRN